MREPEGFAGLRLRLTDVSAELERLAGVPAAAQSAATTSSVKPALAQSDGSHKRLAWFAGVIGVVLVVWLLNSHPDASSSTSVTDYSADTVAAEGVATPSPMPAVEISEVAPPVGTGQELDASQIAYCLAEGVRMTAAQTNIDREDSTQIDAFNAKVDDYNSRCSSYRYRSSDRDQAQAYVDAHHDELVNSGVAEVSTRLDQPVVDPSETNAVPDQGE